jgi:hypothetical protein
VRRKAAVRAELSAWALTDELVDPAETLLRLVSQSSRRVSLYSMLLGQQYEWQEKVDQERAGQPEIPAGVAALIGHKVSAAGKDGDLYDSEEIVRGLVQLEGDERDRCARFSKLAVDAGIQERQVQLAEQQGAAIAFAIRAVVAAAVTAGLPSDLADMVLRVAPNALRELEA